MTSRLRGVDLGSWPVVGGLAVIAVVFGTLNEHFLSAGSVSGLCAVVMTILYVHHGWNPAAAIAITAYYEDFAAAAALEAGFNAYMTKPIRLDELARLVSDLARLPPPDR